MKFSCKSVVGGWQTLITFPDGSSSLVGPVYNDSLTLWDWQRKNLIINLEG